MKRLIGLGLASIMCVSLVACGGESSGGPSESGAVLNPPESTPAQVETTPPVVEETPETPTNAAELGDYHVEIKSASLAQDYKGNPAIVVTYAWTNNSDDTTSSMTAVSCSAFQDGVELETAIITDDSYDSDSFMTEVRPGTTIDIQAAFVLPNTTSIVEVEVGEWITFESDPPIAYMEVNPSEL